MEKYFTHETHYQKLLIVEIQKLLGTNQKYTLFSFFLREYIKFKDSIRIIEDKMALTNSVNAINDTAGPLKICLHSIGF